MSKHLRVLIIRNAYQKDTGGAEQYAFNLALALKRVGHVPIVVTKHDAIRKKCAEQKIHSIEGIWHESQEWDRWYYFRKVHTSLWYAWLIIRHRIDLVHPQSRDDFVFATSAARLLRKPCVWTDHADLKYIMDRINHPHPRMQKWILNASLYAQKIVCVSNSEYLSITAVAPELEPKLAVVYNGVFKPQRINPVEKERFVIGTNARLVPEKGISELLNSFAAVKSAHESAELWLLGGLSNNKDLYSQVATKLGILDSVKFIGYVSNPNDYVASMDIFVHASYHEAFSLAIIEACMLGRPIIATAVGGTPEIINEKTGILIPPRDIKSLTKAITELINNYKLRMKLGKNAQKRAFEEFDFEKIVEEKMQKIYREASK